jgi:hypothetical protein
MIIEIVVISLKGTAQKLQANENPRKNLDSDFRRNDSECLRVANKVMPAKAGIQALLPGVIEQLPLKAASQIEA